MNDQAKNSNGHSVDLAAPDPPLRSVVANLNFYDSHISEPNTFRWTPSRESERPNNFLPPDTHEVRIHDLRSITVEDRAKMGLTVEKAGFETLQGWIADGEEIGKAWAEKKWENIDFIENVYKPYIQRLLTDKFKATKMAIFDHTIRKRTGTDSAKIQDGSATKVPPAEQTHVDQTYWAAIERVRLHLGDDAAQRVLAGSARAIICNLWRPLVGPVSDHPLAVTDFRYLDVKRDFEDTLAAPPGCRTGESQMLRFSPEQRWYYLSGMKTDECFLLKCFDSKTSVRAPHSAFVDPNTPANAEPRWSIEVRTVSIIEDP